MNEMLVNQKTSVINRTPEIIAVEINSIKDQTRNMLLYNSIEIGRRLIEAKSLLQHGEWGKWLEESVDYSQRTAQNLMKIFEEYGANQITLLGDNAKSQAFADLSYSQAVALLGVPEEEREEFIKENDVENMSTRELQQAIKEKEEVEKEKKELEKKLKDAEDKAEENKKQFETISAKYKDLEKTSKDQKKKYEDIKKQLSEAQDAGDNEEVERLQETLEKAETELNESKEKIKELEDQLKAPMESVIVEKVPENIEKELQELRGNVQGANIKARFKVHFDILVKNFNDLLGDLEEMSDDEDLHDKYRNAIHGLIDKMVERL